MTHTLHREGSIDDLNEDFIVLGMPCKGITTDGSGPKLKKFLELALKYDPVNIGDSKAGNQYSLKSRQTVLDKVKDGSVCHAVYDNPESVYKLVRDLKEEDLCMCFTISGLMHVADECCKKAGLQRHTVNMSLGIYGKTEKLASDASREISTMCGHGMVTANLILSMVEKIKKGSITPEKASESLAATCLCGIFNPKRGAKLLRRMAGA